jgi:hypothetical protein
MENKTLLPNWLLDYVEKAIEDFVPPLEWDEPVDVKLEVKRLRREAPIAAIPLSKLPEDCDACLLFDGDIGVCILKGDAAHNGRRPDCPIVTKE